MVNSEALSGDIVFKKQWQKTINLDVRFLLWVIDKYHGAGYLLNEMDHQKISNFFASNHKPRRNFFEVFYCLIRLFLKNFYKNSNFLIFRKS